MSGRRPEGPETMSERAKGESRMADLVRISWNSIIPQVEDIAVAMQEKLSVADGAVDRVLASKSLVAT